MAVRREGNGWRVDVSVRGRGRKTKVLQDYNKAVELEQIFRRALLDGRDIARGRARAEITLKEACEACYNDPESGWKDTEHGKKQQYYFSKFYKFWGEDKLLREIDKNEWYKFTAQFSETATNNRRACCINKVFRHALEQGTITADNLLKIPRKKEKLTRLSTYSYEQEEAIYEQCKIFGFHDLEDFVKVLIDTGCRAQEAIKLSPKDLLKSKDGWTAYVYRHKTDTHTSIGLATRTKEILMRRSNMKTFFETSYRQMTYKWQMVREALGQLDNKDFVFHTCRHTCASRLAEAGSSFMEVCDWMGWSPNSPVAKRYIHFFPKAKINMAKKLDNLRSNLKVVSGGEN